jgi:hypothetical protein
MQDQYLYTNHIYFLNPEIYFKILKFRSLPHGSTSNLYRRFPFKELCWTQDCTLRALFLFPDFEARNPFREDCALCYMRSIGLWRWYINITITILDIIHRPVFYLKLNSTLYVCLYLTGNMLLLRYESNRLMLSIGLWRWYINITITILDIVHRPVFYLKLYSTLQGCPHLTGNTLRLRCKPNR